MESRAPVDNDVDGVNAETENNSSCNTNNPPDKNKMLYEVYFIIDILPYSI
ncbi:hypothetical protein PJIAN_4111 [Paludibacter jiangxiensis]|uniref:Uncharacterized protein n=1 Tax=Paludibacter jiangxiensis TaxID=681398 RepID=A0A161LWL0_9BACT|nr:hypothetical protein PJIAN_4111 [Paludibacter jiangxiensis]